jgi:uncharacterized protein YukE
MDFLGVRNHIREHYSDFTWPKVKLENLCVPKGGAEIVKFTPTQNFIRHFFTPESAYKGMLLYHGVGTGKTCCAIATASTFFEKEGYTILWVTRTTLKSDIYKNMFDQVCNLNLQDKDAPTKSMLSKSWRFNPMSYKQFSNLVTGKNDLYNQLVKLNGAEDPLKKTLLIIDEAHKLYGGNDLSGNERPDMERFKESIMNSYEKSGKDSVRLLMMTATPITNDPMELIKIVNLCKEADRQLPDDYEAFARIYNNPEGMFTKKGARQFLDAISGHVSYLNREKDARQFSQPIIIPVDVPMSGSLVSKVTSKELKEKTDALKKIKAELSARKKQLTKDRAAIKKTCVGLKKTEREECLKRIMEEIKELEKTVKADLDVLEQEKNDIENVVKDVKAVKKDKTTQGGIIMNKCVKKTGAAANTPSPKKLRYVSSIYVTTDKKSGFLHLENDLQRDDIFKMVKAAMDDFNQVFEPSTMKLVKNQAIITYIRGDDDKPSLYNEAYYIKWNEKIKKAGVLDFTSPPVFAQNYSYDYEDKIKVKSKSSTAGADVIKFKSPVHVTIHDTSKDKELKGYLHKNKALQTKETYKAITQALNDFNSDEDVDWDFDVSNPTMKLVDNYVIVTFKINSKLNYKEIDQLAYDLEEHYATIENIPYNMKGEIVVTLTFGPDVVYLG